MRTRIRNKGGLENQPPFLLHFESPGQEQQTFHVTGPPHLSEEFEEMVDVVGNIEGDYNPCDHFKMTHGLSPVNYLVGGESPDWSYYSFSEGMGLYPYLLPEVVREIPLLSTQYLDDFSATAEDHFKTAVQDETSVINFIIELIQVCEGNIKTLKNLYEKVKDAVRRFYDFLKTRGSRDASSYWLAWNFAIKPVIRDVISALSVLKRAEKRLKWLRKVNHTPTKVKYREGPQDVLFEFVPIQDHWVSNDPLYPDESLPHQPLTAGFFVDIEGTVQVSSYAWVKFDIPDYLLDDWVSAIGMITLVMQGLYNPFKIAWEAIPFSWLIEWFTTKRTQLLKELASVSPFPDGEILGTGYSMKCELYGRCYYKVTVPDMAIECGAFQCTRYVRRPGLPTGSSVLWSGDISVLQSSILAALFTVKTFGWRRRSARALRRAFRPTRKKKLRFRREHGGRFIAVTG